MSILRFISFPSATFSICVTGGIAVNHLRRLHPTFGFLIGVLGILIRSINPAFPEGWMLSILLMNIFAPFIDHQVIQANIRRRKARYAA